MKIIAKALLKNGNGEYLLLRRSLTHPHYPHHLDLPGGEVEEDEDIHDAVVREISEEAGMAVAKESLELLFDEIIHADRCILFACRVDGEIPAVTLSWEHDAFMWTPSEDILNAELPNEVDQYYKAVIEHLKK